MRAQIVIALAEVGPKVRCCWLLLPAPIFNILSKCDLDVIAQLS